MSADKAVMVVSVPQLLATIEMMKLQYPVGSECNVGLEFGEMSESERNAALDKLCDGLAMTALQGGLIAVFTGGMLLQREMARQTEFEREMEREMLAE